MIKLCVVPFKLNQTYGLSVFYILAGTLFFVYFWIGFPSKKVIETLRLNVLADSHIYCKNIFLYGWNQPGREKAKKLGILPFT